MMALIGQILSVPAFSPAILHLNMLHEQGISELKWANHVFECPKGVLNGSHSAIDALGRALTGLTVGGGSALCNPSASSVHFMVQAFPSPRSQTPCEVLSDAITADNTWNLIGLLFHNACRQINVCGFSQIELSLITQAMILLWLFVKLQH